jgi:stringent starvation protein B
MDASFKPYLIRAVYEWCADYGHEPYLVIAVDDSCSVPMAHVQQGQIVLDISPESVKDLDLGLEAISFKARFSGVVQHIYAPIHRVIGLFPTHNQQLGVFFEPTDQPVALNVDDLSSSIEKNNSNTAAKTPVSLAKSRIVRVK